MGDQENYPKDKDRENGGKRNQKKPWQKRQQYGGGQDSKKKDPEEIPVLKYGPANNFTKFKEALSKKALKDTGSKIRTCEQLYKV